ncbi:MAG TPA: glycoside hydrolase family 36 protein [Candidatus Acidoferrum sp.]|nr:glycoside hydrolase family 36 protein [Candidatus Acidoferrum sp.]
MTLMSRREMLALGLAGGWWAAAGLRLEGSPPGPASPAISNRYLRARFDLASGLIQAWLADGPPLLINARTRALGPSWSCSSADAGLVRTARTERIQDALGCGTKIVAECADPRRGRTLRIELSLYDERNALLMECQCRNDSNADLRLRTIEPVRAVPGESGLCAWPHLAKSLTNGFLYADPGNLADFAPGHHQTRKSVWNMGFAGRPADPGLTVGFVENDFAIGRIEAAVASYRHREGFSLVGEAFFNQEFVVKPGAAARSGRFALQLGPDPFVALENYAQMIGDAHGVRRPGPIINGWCNWFYDHTSTSEDEIVRNAEFAARELKPYGLEWIQIDDGYQRAFSDWEGNERFPHGMKWLADRIRGLGLRPGIWIAPYVVSEGTDIHRHHPDWLIRNLDGSIRHCGDRGSTKLYGLDISNPAAAEWFSRLFRTVAGEWGYDFIKFDFVEWTILAAERYQDPTWSRAMAYRRGVEIMREAMGRNRHLLDCGPAQTAVGLIDSTRIELDQPFLTWEQYVGAYNSNAPAIAKRYYFHQRTWINDADHLGVSLLTPSQATVAASLIALSGGTMISGDRLTDLDGARLDIVRKVFPSFGEAARPVDLFEREKPEIFVLPVRNPFEEWVVVGLFNYAPGPAVEKSVSLSRLGLDSGQEWLAFEFWQQRLLGKVREELRMPVPAESVALVALRKSRDVPQVVSTDRHFTQGGVELRDVAWSADSNTLAGTSLGGKGTRHNALVRVPPGYALDLEAAELPHDFAGYSVWLLPDGLVRIHVNFEAREDLSWQLKFKRA